MVPMSTSILSAIPTGSGRSGRPTLGAVLLMVSGLMVAYAPIRFASELIVIAGPLTAIGVPFGILIFLTGVGSVLRPDLSTYLGIAGVTFSILSVVGTLGGMLVGLLVGIVGSNLLIAWHPPEAREEPTVTRTDTETDVPSAGADVPWHVPTGSTEPNVPTAQTGLGGESSSEPPSEPATTTRYNAVAPPDTVVGGDCENARADGAGLLQADRRAFEPKLPYKGLVSSHNCWDNK